MPFGGVRAALGPTTQTDFGCTGQREIEGSELMDYNARFLNPGLGRFTQPDTIIPDPANPQGLNRYAYTVNNPIRFTDPSGHCIPGYDCPNLEGIDYGWVEDNEDDSVDDIDDDLTNDECDPHDYCIPDDADDNDGNFNNIREEYTLEEIGEEYWSCIGDVYDYDNPTKNHENAEFITCTMIWGSILYSYYGVDIFLYTSGIPPWDNPLTLDQLPAAFRIVAAGLYQSPVGIEYPFKPFIGTLALDDQHLSNFEPFFFLLLTQKFDGIWAGCNDENFPPACDVQLE